MANILNIGQTALTAAQIGLSTTGHNIANANTEGYSRQTVIQGTNMPEQSSFGFLGKGTEVIAVKRVYNEFLSNQVLNSQTSYNALASYHGQIKQINNLFADSTAGISPAIQDFFKGVQNLAADPSSGAARQTMLSTAETVAGQIRDVDARLNQIREGVNSNVIASVDTINSYAQQIAKLNNSISTVQASNNGKPANDLLDQRDKLVADLSKEIKVTVVKQGIDYNIFIGNGQSLVVGGRTFSLTPVPSATDLTRLQVGYQNNDTTIRLDDSSLAGGKLGGLLEFRSKTLDQVQNSLGRIAIGLGSAFNAQHQLGQDLAGNLGEPFFSVGTPRTSASTLNTGTGRLLATVSDAGELTTSDYRLEYLGSNNYEVTRLSDGSKRNLSAPINNFDGLTISLDAGTPATGDVFLIQPTVNGASSFGVTIRDTAMIAAAAPVRTKADVSNTGTGKISSGSVSSGYVAPNPATTYRFSMDAAGDFTVTPPVAVTVTTSDGNVYPYASGDLVRYSEGARFSIGQAHFTMTGAPNAGDSFEFGPNFNGVGDNRNALLLGALQTAKTLGKGTITFQGAFGQMVNMVGNKTHELDVNQAAETSLLAQSVAAQQSVSGVNLDEEAANLLRYQQAYQAAGKVMQTASRVFDVLLTLGN